MLRWMAAACAVLVSLRVLWEPRIVGTDVGTTPIFNWLLWGYGVPAVAFWIGGASACAGAPTTCRRACSIPPRSCSRCSRVTLQIRHYITGGDIYRHVATLAA